jgi:hypothetical protein
MHGCSAPLPRFRDPASPNVSHCRHDNCRFLGRCSLHGDPASHQPLDKWLITHAIRLTFLLALSGHVFVLPPSEFGGTEHAGSRSSYCEDTERQTTGVRPRCHSPRPVMEFMYEPACEPCRMAALDPGEAFTATQDQTATFESTPLKADCETLNCITDCQHLLCYASGPSIYTRLGLEVCRP